ncbi:MAG: hypothetical protein M3220_12700 [Chloroflexota bacterium]|nr:hypothetical protein [Chloroflexota bacterium]
MDDFILFCLGALVLVAVVALFAYMRRNRPAPRGTYDDPDTRSGGSIGGRPGRPGQRAHDDPDIRSGGSFGTTRGREGARTHDDPDIRSGGSFGGDEASRRGSDNRNRTARSSSSEPPAGRSSAEPGRSSSRDREGPRRDDPDIKSGGSFGG